MRCRAGRRDYTIEDMLGHGGFGIVYRARHNELGYRVAVKEYLPIELVRRSDERPVLIDFGAAKQTAAERSKSPAPYTEG